MKYRKWPPCKMLGLEAPKTLRMAQIYNKDPDSIWIKSKFGDTPIIHYEHIELEKSLEFNNLENIIPYLKDRTISLMRSDILSKYFENVRLEKEWQNTRQLLAYLLNPSMVHDHQKYLRRYSVCKNFNKMLDYLIIRIVPKEKELKVDFRGFGCKTFEDRYRTSEKFLNKNKNK